MKRLDLKNLIPVYRDLENDEREIMIRRIKNVLKRRNNHLTEMMAIVEKQLVNYKQDFYIYDVELMTTNDVSFIWIVRDSGTHWINLDNNDILESDEPANLSYFKALINTTRIKALYHFDNDTKQLIKINQQKAFSLIEQKVEKLAV